jgi:formylglycine-generating enzyme required for sulfatase activity
MENQLNNKKKYLPTITILKFDKKHKKNKGLKFIICAIFFALLSFNQVKANNVVIGTPVVVGADLQFTISWENSWNTNIGPNNWDAVWVFVKRQSCSDNLWTHCLLNTAAVHTVTGAVLQVDPVTDGMGVFIRRSAMGFGNIFTETVTLQLQTAANAIDNFQVFGIEMVSVPQGNFFIGDGTGGSNGWGFRTLLITSAIQTAGIGAANVYQASSYGSTTPLPATYPLGWNNFYCMKYEICQEQYVSFLNCLTFVQQASRTAVAPSSATGTLAMSPIAAPCRNRIEIMTPGLANIQPAVYACDLDNDGIYNDPDDGQNIACNYLSWPDLIAYLDWSGLRPMTEFEYEKVCRGDAAVVLANEYSWGSTNLLQAESGALNNPGQGGETSTASGNGLCAYGISTNTKGPLRCGFAATGATTRLQAGGSYYGAMEMSGNVMEQCLGGYNGNYSTLTTTNGDGSLTIAGTANTIGWPTNGGGNGGGAIGRGGDWFTNNAACLQVSDRAWMTNNTNQGRTSLFGGRGVRSF